MSASPTPGQRKLAIGVSVFLIAGATFIVLFLTQVPLPARLLLAVIDFTIAIGLLTYLRQNPPRS